MSNVTPLRLNKHNGVFVILGLLVLIAGLYSPSFLNGDNSMSMLRQSSALGILAVGQLFVIVGGGIDLSVAATMQLSIMIFMTGYNDHGSAGLVGGLAVALVAGLFIGVVNGLIVTRYRVQPFLVTLFTASIITGLRMIVAGIEPAGSVPDAVRFVGRDRTFGVPHALVLLALVAIAAYVILQKSVYGRRLIAVGTNPTAATVAGIRTARVVIRSYMLCSVMAVIASIALAGYVGFADQWIGAGFEFSSLIAAVIGGNYLGGGRGSVVGAVGGVLTVTFVASFVTLLGLSAPFQLIVSGVVLISALLIGVFGERIRMSVDSSRRGPQTLKIIHRTTDREATE